MPSSQENIQTQKHPYGEIYLNERQAAEKLGVTASAMQAWRLRGGGPRFVRISCRCIRYSLKELESFMEARTVASTADRGPDVSKSTRLQTAERKSTIQPARRTARR